ncbi:hypothetical protein ACFWPU_13770 [Streptomyces sp. NPDC058471]|uniref:hypothetical protein n=1 Tax=Streptomyces sp. NPDC058471 TaxID=3346516 RepID=UPI0036473E4C
MTIVILAASATMPLPPNKQHFPTAPTTPKVAPTHPSEIVIDPVGEHVTEGEATA